jgi:hypothetical protein
MSYLKNVWKEHGHTTAQKLTALDNLEGMYDEAISYIDAITHGSLYYTDAQAAAKFFTSANDGSGSGLVAATLDGYSAQQIIDAGSPSGVIAWWAGSEASIPDGWLLCNGLNGTPDLRDHFVVGSGSHYAKGAVGGNESVTTAAAVTIAGHVLTVAEIAKHTHSVSDFYNAQSSFYIGSVCWCRFMTLKEYSRTTGSTGSGTAHNHTATYAGSAEQSILPPYYAICFIMKV